MNEDDKPEVKQEEDTSFEDAGHEGTAPADPAPDYAAMIDAQNARIEELFDAVAALAQTAQLGAALDADNGVGADPEEYPEIDLADMTRMIGY